MGKAPLKYSHTWQKNVCLYGQMSKAVDMIKSTGSRNNNFEKYYFGAYSLNSGRWIGR
jgi:hypothetical protein